MAESVRYEVDGWGVGELWLDGAMLLWHELPRPRGSDVGVHLHHSLAERIAAHFAGERDSFGDVELDLEGYTAFQQAVVATRRIDGGEILTRSRLDEVAAKMDEKFVDKFLEALEPLRLVKGVAESINPTE